MICLARLLLVPAAVLAAAADPRPFDPVKDVQIVCSRGEVALSVPAGSHLKGRFLSVVLVSGPGWIRMGRLPKARDLDEAGDPIYRGQVRIPLSGQGLSGDVELDVRYQPCTEGAQGVCYLPMARRLRVAAAEIPAAEGAGAPESVLATTGPAGNPFSLASVQGRAVLVDFWASWCGPCRKSFPRLEALNARYSAQGLKVVGVSLDEDPAAANRFLQSVPVTFQIVLDPSGLWARHFHIAVMPTTLLLDGEGQVVARFEGGGGILAEEAALSALLAGKPLPPGTGSRAAAGLRATGGLKAWDRGHLADPILNISGDSLSRALWEHIHASKEGAAGTGGAAGGGCGCN